MTLRASAVLIAAMAVGCLVGVGLVVLAWWLWPLDWAAGWTVPDYR